LSITFTAVKKAFAAILLLVYFTVSTGFSLSIHYCMDRFSSAEIGRSANDKCDKCGMHKRGGCCRDVVKVVKLETSHIVSQIASPAFSILPAQLITTEYLLTPFENSQEYTASIDHGPPPGDPDVQVRNCVFRI